MTGRDKLFEDLVPGLCSPGKTGDPIQGLLHAHNLLAWNWIGH